MQMARRSTVSTKQVPTAKNTLSKIRVRLNKNEKPIAENTI